MAELSIIQVLYPKLKKSFLNTMLMLFYTESLKPYVYKRGDMWVDSTIFRGAPIFLAISVLSNIWERNLSHKVPI